MKKRILSLLLAVLVLAAAMPLGFMVAAEGESELEPAPIQLDVIKKTDANKFPADAGTYWPTWGTSDPGANNNFAAYAAYDGKFVTEYLIDSGASNGAMKVVYDPTNGKNGDNNVRVYLKAVPHVGANAVGIHVDATGIANDPAVDTDDYFYTRIGFMLRNCAGRQYAAGFDYYFLADEEGAELETLTVPTAASHGEAYVALKAGVSGTYFFLDEGFQNTTAEKSGYDFAYSYWKWNNELNANEERFDLQWDSFDCDYARTDWLMDNNNFGNTYFSFYQIKADGIEEGEFFVADNLCYATIGEKQPEEILPQYVVNRQNIVNNFPASGSTLLKGDGYATSDPGASNNLAAYAESGTNEFDINYVLADGATDGAIKVSYNSANASYTQNAVYVYRKGVPHKGANAIGIYIDATGFANDPSTEEDDYLKVLIGTSTRSDAIRYYAAGYNYYFLSDEEGAVLETIKNPTAANNGEAYIKIFTGKKGYYYFPEEGFCNTTADVSGYDYAYTGAQWTSFSDDWMQTEWVMDNRNYGSTYLSIFKMFEPGFVAGGSLIIDNLCFASIGEPEAPRELPLKIANICEGFDGQKDTSVVSTWQHNNEGVEPSFKLVGDTDKSIEMIRLGTQNYANVKLPDNNNKYVPDANGITFHIDATKDTENTMLRLSFVSGPKGNQIWYGNTYYFLEDGKPESEFEEKAIGGSGQWSSWMTVFGGKSGTYYVPLTAFEIPEGSADYSENYDFKVADRVNKTVETVRFQFSGTNTNPIYIDDIGYTTADGSWNIPPQAPFPYMYSHTFTNFRNGELLFDKGNNVGTVGCWDTITAADNISFSGSRMKVKFGKSTDKTTAISFSSEYRAYSSDKAFSFTVDASKVASKISMRGTLGRVGESGYRNTGGNGIYYLIPADGSDYIEKVCAGERFDIPAGFKGTVVLPFECFNGGGDNIPAKPTGKQMSKWDGVSLSLYIFEVTSRNNTLVFSRCNFMTDNDGTGPITGVEDHTPVAIALLIAAAFVATVSIKKGLKVVAE